MENITNPRDVVMLVAEELEQIKSASAIAFVTLAQSEQIDGVTIAEHPSVFSPWAEGAAFAAKDIRLYDGLLYRCAQGHTSQSGWEPPNVPALWSVIGAPGDEYPPWSQPYGAHDAYQTGDKCTYNGVRYVSNVNNNVYPPGVVAGNWKEAAS